MAKVDDFINNDEELALKLGHRLHFLWGVTIHYRQLLKTFNLTKQSVTGVLIFILDDDRYPWIRMNIYNCLGAEPGRDFNQFPLLHHRFHRALVCLVVWSGARKTPCFAYCVFKHPIIGCDGWQQDFMSQPK